MKKETLPVSKSTCKQGEGLPRSHQKIFLSLGLCGLTDLVWISQLMKTIKWKNMTLALKTMKLVAHMLGKTAEY